MRIVLQHPTHFDRIKTRPAGLQNFGRPERVLDSSAILLLSLRRHFARSIVAGAPWTRWILCLVIVGEFPAHAHRSAKSESETTDCSEVNFHIQTNNGLFLTAANSRSGAKFCSPHKWRFRPLKRLVLPARSINAQRSNPSGTFLGRIAHASNYPTLDYAVEHTEISVPKFIPRSCAFAVTSLPARHIVWRSKRRPAFIFKFELIFGPHYGAAVVTADMRLLADLLRKLDHDHSNFSRWRLPKSQLLNGRIRSVSPEAAEITITGCSIYCPEFFCQTRDPKLFQLDALLLNGSWCELRRRKR